MNNGIEQSGKKLAEIIYSENALIRGNEIEGVINAPMMEME